MLSESHSVAALRNAASTRARSRKPPERRGTSTSRIALSGTRASSRSRPPSGLTKAFTVTSFGMSWAAALGDSTNISAATGETIRRSAARVLTRVFPASSIVAAQLTTERGANEKHGRKAHALYRRGLRFSTCRARSLPGPARKQGRHAGPNRPGAQIRGRSAVAEAAAQPLAARHDHRRLGRRAGPRLDHPSRRADAFQHGKG